MCLFVLGLFLFFVVVLCVCLFVLCFGDGGVGCVIDDASIHRVMADGTEKGENQLKSIEQEA